MKKSYTHTSLGLQSVFIGVNRAIYMPLVKTAVHVQIPYNDNNRRRASAFISFFVKLLQKNMNKLLNAFTI
jgi:hypothetical protein